MKLQDQLRFINDSEYKPPVYDRPGEYIKGYIMCDINDNNSMYATRKAAASIKRSKSLIDYTLYPYTTQHTIERDLERITAIKDAKKLQWTWPLDSSQNGPCLKSNVYKRHDGIHDNSKVICNTVTHMLLWQQCIDINQPIVVMQPNIKFMRKFDYKTLRYDYFKIDKEQGVKDEEFNESLIGLGINKEELKESMVIQNSIVGPNKRGFYRTPFWLGYTNEMAIPKNSHPFPGSHCYTVTPWAAKQLLANVEKVGMWPVWHLMSYEMAPWALTVFPRFATTLERELSPVLDIKK